MRTPRRVNKRALGVAAALFLIAGGVSGAAAADGRDPVADAQAWRSAFQPRVPMHMARRVIVVLGAPSLADRAAQAGHLPTARAQRGFVHQADRFQRRLLALLRERGIAIHRVFVYTRVLNGFSAIVDPRALAALSHAPGVAGIYPVRSVYPAASLTEQALADPGVAMAPAVTLPGMDGHGVTIALLDSGVDRDIPALRGRVRFGVDLVDRDADVTPASVDETHGTRMASLLVGAHGVSGVAPGARVLPIRIIGAQTTSHGVSRQVGRGDVLLAGIERAVDPDRDGDVEDAAKVALAAVTEPYASFGDSPESRAVAGALRLGTLVVAAAGNDGPSGEGGFGTVGAPAGAASALAVGALDQRTDIATVNATLTAGDQALYAGVARLLGGAPPAKPLNAEVTAAASRGEGQAVLLPADGAPVLPRVQGAVLTGAAAVAVYGSVLPAGSLGIEEGTAVPVLALPADAGRAAAAAVAAGANLSLSIEAADASQNSSEGAVAAFSSGGIAFDGRVKPDLVAPGVGLAASDPGTTPDGSPRFAVVTGTSAAAAVAAGAAALVAEARPELSAAGLRSVLIGSARQLTPAAVEPVTAAGAGLIDPVAADAAELAVRPTTIAVQAPTSNRWTQVRRFTVQNVSTRELHVGLGITTDLGASHTFTFAADPAQLTLAPGESSPVRLVLSSASRVQPPATVSGVLIVSADGGPSARVPWVVSMAPLGERLIRQAWLSESSFRPGRLGSVLSFVAGNVRDSASGPAIHPVGIVDVELWTGAGKRLGTVARMHDVLPGRYAVALMGRAPDGRRLRPGRYVLHLVAQPVSAGEVAAAAQTTLVPFRILAAR
jgi:hypothetical protein